MTGTDGRRRHASGTGSAPGVLIPSYVSFILIGWTGLFVPSLLRVLRADFARTEAEFGLVYLVMSIAFATGALGSGLVAGHVGRRVVLPASALLIAAGMLIEAVAPTWLAFVAGAGLAAGGCGAIDAVGSSVIMDLSSPGSGGGLNMLHLFYSVGALVAPVAIGVLVEVGVAWQILAVATGLGGLLMSVPLARVGSVPPRPRPADGGHPGERTAVMPAAKRLALVALCVAIACYVASEQGVSSWLVGFLDDQPMTVATLGLTLFWGGLAGARLIASRFADRFDPVRFTAACALAGGAVILAAVLAAGGPARVVLFLGVGFALGPVYPMIVAVAGALFPHRAAAVAGIVTAAGVTGAIVYPPVMGLIASVAGLGVAMIGAAALAAASGGAVVLAGRLGRGRHRLPERAAVEAASG